MPAGHQASFCAAAATEGRTSLVLEKSSRTLLAGKIMDTLSSVPATAMVVDHDEQASEVVAAVLASLGCKVIQTPDGESALATLRTEPPVDLLLTDVLLRGSIDGLELARLATAANPRIEIIYSTSYSSTFLLDSEAPHDRLLLRKPWQSGKLTAILSSVLSEQRRAARESADDGPAALMTQ